jgi:hypothetical protein
MSRIDVLGRANISNLLPVEPNPAFTRRQWEAGLRVVVFDRSDPRLSNREGRRCFMKN